MDLNTLKTFALAGLISLAVGLPASAQVYKVRDAQGNVTYTDTPPKDRPYEEVTLRPINSQPPVEARSDTEQEQAQDEAEPVNYALRMARPEDGTQVPPGQRDVQLAVELSPQLDEGHRIQFMMNGEPLSPPTRDSQWAIREIHRGEHQLSARLLDSNNRILAQAPPVTVFVHRPTVLSPARNSPSR